MLYSARHWLCWSSHHPLRSPHSHLASAAAHWRRQSLAHLHALRLPPVVVGTWVPCFQFVLFKKSLSSVQTHIPRKPALLCSTTHMMMCASLRAQLPAALTATSLPQVANCMVLWPPAHTQPQGHVPDAPPTQTLQTPHTRAQPRLKASPATPFTSGAIREGGENLID